MSTWEYRAATAGKLARIEEKPRFVVVTELRAGLTLPDRSRQAASAGLSSPYPSTVDAGGKGPIRCQQTATKEVTQITTVRLLMLVISVMY